MTLEQLLQINKEPDWEAMRECRRRWDAVAHPLGSLGLLEDALVRIAGVTGCAEIDLSKKAVVVLCADNGVVAEGVTQTGQEVTALVAKALCEGTSSVCRMAKVAGAQVIPVDMGMAQRVEDARLLQRRVASGTKNIARGAAMSRAQAVQAVETGIELVRQLKEQGFRLIATGEMGIGNTTTASAVTSVLLNVSPQQVTGRGAGLSSEGLECKCHVIEQAIAVNCPDAANLLEVLATVGGFDIAGMVGIFLGGAFYGVPILADGVISCVAALVAVRLWPSAAFGMLASHRSAEPAGKMLLDALGLHPLLDCGMRLGEGTGAVAAMPLLDMAAAVYNQMNTFSQWEMKPYEHLQ